MKPVVFCLMIGLLIAEVLHAAESDEQEARNLNLSMAGALINDWCERNWQGASFISIYACNYQYAQLYNFDSSATDFNECIVITGGDIVRIADCMQYRFNAWLESSQAVESEIQ